MDMPMSSGSHSKIEVITGVQRRRRWTPEQKLARVRQTTEPGMSVSLVARLAYVLLGGQRSSQPFSTQHRREHALVPLNHRH